MSGPPPVTARLKLAFGIGTSAEAMVITGLTQFAFIYYNQVRGLAPAAVGLAFSAGLAVNAVCDPIVGSWSDRTRSRLGRRHPFMFAAILPVVAAFWAVFNPPAGLGAGGQLAWLVVANIVCVQMLTVFHTPHLALGGELSTTYVERSSVMAWNTFLAWGGDSLCWVLSFGWFFRATSRYANGTLNPAPYPAFSLFIAAAVGCGLLASAWFTLARLPWLPPAAAGVAAFSPRAFFHDVRHALSNRNYVVLLVGSLLFSLMSGLRSGLWLYTATFLWRLSTAQVSWFVVGSLIGYVLSATVVVRIHRRFDKRWANVLAVVIYSLGPAIPLALAWAGVWDSRTPFLVPLLIGFGAIGHAGYSLMLTSINSMIADIADENELRFGDREEGVLYSTRTFFLKLDQAAGSVVAGWVLAVIAFPVKALPGHIGHATELALAAAFVLSAVPGLVAAAVFAAADASQARFAGVRAGLAARTAALDGEPAG